MINSVIVCVKDVKMLITLKKKTCLGVLNKREQGDGNETSLKEGGGIEMSNYSAFHIRDAPLLFASLRFEYLPLELYIFLGLILVIVTARRNIFVVGCIKL